MQSRVFLSKSGIARVRARRRSMAGWPLAGPPIHHGGEAEPQRVRVWAGDHRRERLPPPRAMRNAELRRITRPEKTTTEQLEQSRNARWDCESEGQPNRVDAGQPV